MADFSFQLYSARKFPPLSDTLALLSRLGYRQVEGFGGVYEDVGAVKADLDANGLSMPTGHFGLDQLKDKAGTLAVARGLGIETIICPFIPQERWKQTDGEWVNFARELDDFAKAYRDEGLGFAWHNHQFEFWPLESGRTPMQIILDEAPEVGWEMDVAWVVRGEDDPFEWIDRYADRIIAVHLKDIAPEGEASDEDGWADVGHGTMNWTELMTRLRTKTPAKHFVMEHDNPNDLERFASRSITTANSL